MNFINLITAFVIFGVFLSGFSQILLPAYRHWENTFDRYKTAKTIYFVSESFKNECAKVNRNMDNWGNLVSSAKELEEYTISEVRKDGKLLALRAIFVIDGEQIEVLGAVSP